MPNRKYSWCLSGRLAAIRVETQAPVEFGQRLERRDFWDLKASDLLCHCAAQNTIKCAFCSRNASWSSLPALHELLMMRPWLPLTKILDPSLSSKRIKQAGVFPRVPVSTPQETQKETQRSAWCAWPWDFEFDSNPEPTRRYRSEHQIHRLLWMLADKTPSKFKFRRCWSDSQKKNLLCIKTGMKKL